MRTRQEIQSAIREVDTIMEDFPEIAYWKYRELYNDLERLQASEALEGNNEHFRFNTSHI